MSIKRTIISVCTVSPQAQVNVIATVQGTASQVLLTWGSGGGIFEGCTSVMSSTAGFHPWDKLCGLWTYVHVLPVP